MVEHAPIYVRRKIAWFPRKKINIFLLLRIFGSIARQFIQRARNLPPPGTTRTFPSRWAFIQSDARRFIRGARLLSFSVKMDVLLLSHIFSIRRAPSHPAAQISSAPLVRRERAQAAGHLCDWTCADLSAAPGCLVSSVKKGVLLLKHVS